MIRQELERREKMVGYDLVASYEAGIPTYRVRLRVQIEKKLDVAAIAQSTLRLIDLGLNTEPQLVQALGVEPIFVHNVLETLERAQLVIIRKDLIHDQLVMTMTSDGKEAIRDALKTKTSTTIEILVDGITGEISTYVDEWLAAGEDLRKRNGWPLHATPGNRPTTETLDKKRNALNQALQTQQGQTPDIDR